MSKWVNTDNVFENLQKMNIIIVTFDWQTIIIANTREYHKWYKKLSSLLVFDKINYFGENTAHVTVHVKRNSISIFEMH